MDGAWLLDTAELAGGRLDVWGWTTVDIPELASRCYAVIDRQAQPVERVYSPRRGQGWGRMRGRRFYVWEPSSSLAFRCLFGKGQHFAPSAPLQNGVSFEDGERSNNLKFADSYLKFPDSV